MLRPMLSEIKRCGSFVQYLHWQFARFWVSSCISHSACGINSLVERNLEVGSDPAGDEHRAGETRNIYRTTEIWIVPGSLHWAFIVII